MQNSLYLWPMESGAEELVFLEAHMRSLDIRISCCGERAEKRPRRNVRKKYGFACRRIFQSSRGRSLYSAGKPFCFRWKKRGK